MTKTRKKNGEEKNITNSKKNLNILPSFQHFVVTSSFIIFNTYYNQNSKLVHGASYETQDFTFVRLTLTSYHTQKKL